MNRLYGASIIGFAPEGWQAAIVSVGRFALTLAVVLIGGTLICNLGRSFVRRSFRRHQSSRSEADNRRMETIQALVNSVIRYAVFFIGALIILDAAGVPVASLIASAGLVGLAVGFGAQSLVRDVITGFFILLEDQYVIGDYVNVAAIEGIVEDVGLRTTRIRDFGGDLHTIPNGEIGRVTNKSRGPRRALVRVELPYEADLIAAELILQRMAQEAQLALPEIVDGPTVLGITDLGNATITFTILAKTTPMAEWKVERELRRRSKLALDEGGILPPYPRQVQLVSLHDKDEKGNP